jgi:hypothetical protein
MSSLKTRQDGISTARKKWAIRDQLTAAPTDRRNGIGATDQTGALYQLLISTANQKGYFFAAPVNERDLASDINLSATDRSLTFFKQTGLYVWHGNYKSAIKC